MLYAKTPAHEIKFSQQKSESLAQIWLTTWSSMLVEKETFPLSFFFIISAFICKKLNRYFSLSILFSQLRRHETGCGVENYFSSNRKSWKRKKMFYRVFITDFNYSWSCFTSDTFSRVWGDKLRQTLSYDVSYCSSRATSSRQPSQVEWNKH